MKWLRRATQRAGWKGRKTLESANPHPVLWQRGFMEMTKPSPGPRSERRGKCVETGPRGSPSSRFNGVTHRFHSSVTWGVGADPVRLHRGRESGDSRLIDGEVPSRGAEKPGRGAYGGRRHGARCGDVHAAGEKLTVFTQRGIPHGGLGMLVLLSVPRWKV